MTKSSTVSSTYVQPQTTSVTVLQTLLQTFSQPQSQPKIPQKKSQMPHTTLHTAPQTVRTTVLQRYFRTEMTVATTSLISRQTCTRIVSTIATTTWISLMTGWSTQLQTRHNTRVRLPWSKVVRDAAVGVGGRRTRRLPRVAWPASIAHCAISHKTP